MKPFRLSIKSVLAAVAVIAIDCMVVRSLRSRPRPVTGDLDSIILNALPMANLLTVGIAVLFQGRERDRSRPFLRGFVACGGLALFAFIGLAIARPESIDFYLVSIFDFLGERTGLDMTSYAWALFEEIGSPALVSLPQVFAALSGGCLARKLNGHSGVVPGADLPHERLRRGSVLVFLSLIAAPALLIEGALHWMVDPKIARLGVGSEAVLSIEDPTGFWVELPNRAPFVVPNGTRVRIVDDAEAPRSGFANHPIPTKGLWPVCDSRPVRVTLLDGEGAGSRTWFHRCHLKPIR